MITRKIPLQLLRIVLLFCASADTRAQSVSTSMGARAAAMGGASATLSDEWSLFNNVGGLAGIRQPTIACAYELPSGLPGANRMAAAFSTPLRAGVCGVGVFRFGDDLYSEQLISAGFGHHLGLTSLGLAFHYVQYRAGGMAPRNAISISAGGIVRITPQITVGARIINLNQPRLSSIENERLPTRLVAGIGFTLTEKIKILGEIEKDIDFRPTVKGGAEYAPFRKILFRTGFTLGPDEVFFGFGFVRGNLTIDYALCYSTSLSFAQQASVIYRMKKKNLNET
jgi:hypothetical protein